MHEHNNNNGLIHKQADDFMFLQASTTELVPSVPLCPHHLLYCEIAVDDIFLVWLKRFCEVPSACDYV